MKASMSYSNALTTRCTKPRTKAGTECWPPGCLRSATTFSVTPQLRLVCLCGFTHANMPRCRRMRQCGAVCLHIVKFRQPARHVAVNNIGMELSSRPLPCITNTLRNPSRCACRIKLKSIWRHVSTGWRIRLRLACCGYFPFRFVGHVAQKPSRRNSSGTFNGTISRNPVERKLSS